MGGGFEPGFGSVYRTKFQATLDTKISPLKIVNESYDFTSTLATLVNNSFEQGIFPEHLKTAKVVPMHKEGCKQTFQTICQYLSLSVFLKSIKR